MKNDPSFHFKFAKNFFVFCLAFASIACQITNPYVDWKKSPPTEQGMDPAKLEELKEYISKELPHIRSFLISRNGYLVFEEYFQGYTRNDYHDIYSVTKNIISALIGIALKEGSIRSLDQRISDFFPEFFNDDIDPRVRSITIRHLLTMTSGYDCEDKGCYESWVKHENPIKFLLKSQLSSSPGEKIIYSSPASHILSGIITKATGRSALEFGDQYLFKPLSISKPFWPADQQGNHFGCGSSSYRPRDLLKFGNLYLRKGLWKDNQIILASYIEESTKEQIRGQLWGHERGYGYLWYIGALAGHSTYNASGFGGQFLYVIPDLDLVIVCLSNADQQHPENYAVIEKFVLPSISSVKIRD